MYWPLTTLFTEIEATNVKSFVKLGLHCHSFVHKPKVFGLAIEISPNILGLSHQQAQHITRHRLVAEYGAHRWREICWAYLYGKPKQFGLVNKRMTMQAQLDKGSDIISGISLASTLQLYACMYVYSNICGNFFVGKVQGIVFRLCCFLTIQIIWQQSMPHWNWIECPIR